MDSPDFANIAKAVREHREGNENSGNALKEFYSEVEQYTNGGLMGQEIAQVTVVPESKDIKDYQRGDIGCPLRGINDSWYLSCPGCGTLGYLSNGRIIENDDKTVSTTQPLHCHGRKAMQRYSIDHNRIKWV